jgi:hypothetical protein
MKRNEGISLIVLVITIIIIIILTGSVILNLTDNNPIGTANTATFKENIGEYNSELAMVLSNEYLKNNLFNPLSLNAGVWNGNETNITGTIKEYIKSITVEDAGKFVIQNGKLVYVGESQEEIDLLSEVNVSNVVLPIPLLGTNVIAIANSTVNGEAPSYNNPIIPKGFKAINDGTIWPTGWNEGLIIEDTVGNQFVWVPVDGTNVIYEKWCVTGISNLSTTNDSLPTGIVNESDQITKYKGFYIARYEAMFDYNNGNRRVASKKSEAVTSTNWSTTRTSAYNGYLWNYINYTDAKSFSQNMAPNYGYTTVKTGLVTGTQWDTIMKWIKNSGLNVETDSTAWGNFKDSSLSAKVEGYGALQISGFSEYWKAKNIYDIAGNTWDWTSELYGANSVFRGGSYFNSRIEAANRYYVGPSFVTGDIVFRPVLYVL